MTQSNRISARITPESNLEILSQLEVSRLLDASSGGLKELFRRCALAVMNSGSYTDDATAVFEEFQNFDVQIVQQDRGIKLEVINAPASAFVDGRMIRGIRELLFAVLRDIVYVSTEIQNNRRFDLNTPSGITNAVFAILRNARVLIPNREPSLVVCWGGHSISRHEYDYTKEVGYALGLRDLDICTGCGPGAMKGPMKGANIAHSKQRRKRNRYMGISEPGIIAAESPNPIVNELVIMPDIEKRLEAFVRVGHGIIVFPGGAGTAEEILYLLGILLHPDNEDVPFPLVFTGPSESAGYFRQIDDFIAHSIGPKAQNRYQIIVDDPSLVAQTMRRGVDDVRDFRVSNKDAFFFNWILKIMPEFQQTFDPTHENMANLDLHLDQEPHILAANLRRAFSGIVAGNVKPQGIREIKKHGKFVINGAPDLMKSLDALLASFVSQQRMKLPGSEYIPCYEVSTE